MITYIKKDVITVDNGIIAHGCNCQGVMGAGVALALVRKWPSIFPPYVDMCRAYNRSKELLGMVHYARVEHHEEGHNIWDFSASQVVVANIFTQHFYGRAGIAYADLEAIATGLDHVLGEGLRMDLPIYMSRIGCNLGGLKWDTQVGPVVEKLADKYPNVSICVCDL
jgi:O-acetyl-ADP-ribose deacetylase (regulator of RNase III)